MSGTIVLLTGLMFLIMKIDFKNDKDANHHAIALYMENESGEYELSNNSSFPRDGYELNLEKSSCTNGGTLSQNETTKEISVTLSTEDKCTIYFDKEKFDLKEAMIAIDNGRRPKGVNSSTPDFDEPATTDEGVFEMEDDYGISYYYRGAVENNYVKFAGFYWRIIRINGDGSVRIIYDGTKAHANGDNSIDRFTHINQVYNQNNNDAKYIGWMYGPSGTTASTSKEQAQTNTVSSTIKTVVDSWYKTNIADKGYGSAVADVIFCNDRSTPGSTVTGWSSDTGLGYGTNKTAFGIIGRRGLEGTPRYDNPQPQFTCPQKNDAFTMSDTVKGNGALTYPIGLITGDEITTAGTGKNKVENRSYYLYHPSNWYWSITPDAMDNVAAMSVIYTYGRYGAADVSVTTGSVAPVINLRTEYVKNMIGTGISIDPYRAADVIP